MNLTLDRSIAGLFCIGFDTPTLTDDARRLIDRGVGGVILFKRNVVDQTDEVVQRFAELTAEIKRHAGRPILVAIDQEGGRVSRLREPFTPIPSMRDLGRTNDVNAAKAVGRIIGRELRAVNVDLNFAPVVDVDTNPANPVIADRSIGADVDLVSKLGAAVIDGTQAEGVAACAKHFPGHGDTSVDSHYALPSLEHAMERLNRVELPPFTAAVKAGVASVMTAHVLFRALDAHVPATMSAAVITGVLRNHVGFDGVVITDDLEMKAIANHFGVERAAPACVAAGVDLVLVCHRPSLQNGAIDAVTAAVKSGEISEGRIAQSTARLTLLMQKFERQPAEAAARSAIGCAEHRAVVDRIGQIENVADPTDYVR